MALVICSECGKSISDQAKVCPHCGGKKGHTSKKKMMKLGVLLGSVVLGIGIFVVYLFFSPYTVEWCCYHRKENATCIEAEKCSRCGKSWGEPLGHSWKVATCTEAKSCETCLVTEGQPQGHAWKVATCIAPKTCSLCNMTTGTALGHSGRIGYCSRCDEYQKELLNEYVGILEYVYDMAVLRSDIISCLEAVNEANTMNAAAKQLERAISKSWEIHDIYTEMDYIYKGIAEFESAMEYIKKAADEVTCYNKDTKVSTNQNEQANVFYAIRDSVNIATKSLEKGFEELEKLGE